ncbi:hypothetical protein D1818_02400 [Aquimarina sp. BL5]|uniref:hypothetical protein n=1 Tax=Aquimarina sp. BL5 TaxID=1714860 RepID=UPI000E540F0F|nr:hypothetical protein [Aquimarina sp. BL5]AXT49724.1 hypothetical protein D1818_02400 [Aquimarina sp. BL5]RKM92369.1 hypothetical protein D7036_22905 [Aquimarina sp. BL5]
MKKVAFVLLFLYTSYSGFSQNAEEASVEKSIFGIQIGVMGVWVHNELKLSNQVVLRSEVGIAIVGLWAEGNDTQVGNGYSLPIVALEPRWYYNLNKRASQGKRIDCNSGNYVSLRGSYYFYDDVDTDTQRNLSSHPFTAISWGIRRNIGNHFNYEAGVGVGLGFGNNTGREIGLTPYFNLKIGYRF